MEQRHGKNPPLFGGNQVVGGSQGGMDHDEESGHKDHTEDPKSSRGTHSHSHMASRTTPRPYMPTFLEARPRDTNDFGHGGIEDEWEDMEIVYNSLSAGFQRQVSLGEYCHIMYKRKSKGHYKGDNELGRKARRMEMPHFDGSSQISVKAWVQKMDSYLQMNAMEEEKAIKFATLHLNGKAHDWWFHGMTSLGHEHVTSYIDFTQRLIDKFDREDPKLHFKELTQIR
jgi:hypothetical protein